jgi:hypothetical protein
MRIDLNILTKITVAILAEDSANISFTCNTGSENVIKIKEVLQKEGGRRLCYIYSGCPSMELF